MKTACLIFLFVFWNSFVFAQQFYIRGEVKDENGNPLQNVVILQQRTGLIFRTGIYGSFGIISSCKKDTFNVSLTGYETEKVIADADNYTTVKLKLTPVSKATVRKNKLSSFTLDLEKNEQKKWFAGDETYSNLVENHFVDAKKFPVTGISPDIDRASYSNIRRFINLNTYVPNDAVRIEEMLNYFNINYKEPEGKNIFNIKTEITSCPWNKDNQLFFINLSAKKIDLDSLPPSNLVFLIDVSGSMDMVNRLPLLKSAFRMLVNNLRAKDTVSIVVYGGVTGVMLPPTSGAEKEKILTVIDDLSAGGFTPGESGIRAAYTLAKNQFIKNGNNRVILATDGDFNVGVKTEDELNELISQYRESGIYLTCLGVGMGNYKDSKIQTLARKGNGNFAYLDNFQEAEKVLMKEFTQFLYSVADDVYMNVEFNPDYVKQYRLIGFENKVGALSDTLSIIEGGEIGSGYSMMAAFEIEPTDVNKTTMQSGNTKEKFCDIKLQYRLPNDTAHSNFSFGSPFQFHPFDKIDSSYRFSAAVILFGSLLRESFFTKNIGWNELLALATESCNINDQQQKEFITLIQKAKSLYSRKNKRKRNVVNY